MTLVHEASIETIRRNGHPASAKAKLRVGGIAEMSCRARLCCAFVSLTAPVFQADVLRYRREAKKKDRPDFGDGLLAHWKR